ncbi:MAG: DUF1624 domain-containing protein [Chitinivibrionales bacterium]|nr:DUF1624 domain-containing protein [Chitinivibrionales bacterium]
MINPAPSRISSIDCLRGLAVVLMVQQHMMVWLWREAGTNLRLLLEEYPVVIACNALGGFAAPLFITLAGAGAYLYLSTPGTKVVTLLCRGMVLFAFGLLLNLCVPSWFSPGSWYVLHVLGVCLAGAPLLRHVNKIVLFWMSFAAILCAPALQYLIDTPLAMGNTRMSDFSLSGGVLRLALVEGHFPVFPWAGFFIAGYIAGEFVRNHRPRPIFIHSMLYAGCGGLLALWGSLAKLSPDSFVYRIVTLSSRIYPAFAPLSFLLLGATLLLIGTGDAAERKFPLFKWTFGLQLLGRSSLSMLLLHVVVFRQLFIMWDLHRIFSLAQSVAIVLFFIALWVLLVFYWRKISLRGGAEWFMRTLSA